MKNTSTRRLQEMLRYISRYYDSVPEIAVDGVFGEQTEQAVKQAQRLFGFEPTGQVDDSTFSAISELYRRLKEQNDPPMAVNVFPSDAEALEHGSSGMPQMMLNLMLGSLHSVFGNLPEINSLESFGEDTARAVALFQRLAGVEPTGKVDRSTWNGITRLFNNYCGGKS